MIWRWTFFLTIATWGGIAPCLAQAPLDLVERSVAEHDYEAARIALARWRDDSSDPPLTDRIRARYLEGVLEAEPTRAERLFLAIAVDHPRATQAADALLRVGQIRYAAGEHERAQVVFDRVLTDYPEATDRASAAYWAILNRLAMDDRREACRTLVSLSPAVRSSVETRVEHLPLRCREQAEVAADEEARPPPSASPPSREAGEEETLSVVEAGPFSDMAEAIEVRDRLVAAGIDAFLMRRGGETGTRVWLGAPSASDDAAALAERASGVGVDVQVTSVDGDG